MAIPVNLKGEVSPLIKCLANEELLFHQQNKMGPLYWLNQKFINNLAGGNNIILEEKLFRSACQTEENQPSFELLKHIILNGIKVFSINTDDFRTKSQQQSILDVIETNMLHIFMNFLSKLQMQVNSAHCLKENLPHLNYFLNKTKYLEENISSRKILADKDKLVQIFDKLRSFEAIRLKCQ